MERAHQTIGSILCTFKPGMAKLDLEDPWGSIISAENAKWKQHEYRINNKVMVKNNQKQKYGTNVYIRPYWITKVNNNITVQMEFGKIMDTYNIQHIMLYRK
eukprot:6569724-Ditylum_brightwellii.AAC.2